MKSFRHYITEANPVVDEGRRKEASRLYDAIFSALEKRVKSSNVAGVLQIFTEKSLIGDQEMVNAVGIPVGFLCGESEYNELLLKIAIPDGKYGGYFAGKARNGGYFDIILLSRLDIKAKTVNWQKNPKPLWKMVTQLKSDLSSRKIFVHEFIHYLDDKRYTPTMKNQSSGVAYAKQDMIGYYNHFQEVHAHAQEMIFDIDDFYTTYYGDTLNSMRKVFLPKANRAKTEDEVEDILYFLTKVAFYYETLNNYATNTKVGMERVLNQISVDKQKGFMAALTPENKKKVYALLYQYYTDVLRPKMVKMTNELKDIAKKIKNSAVIERFKSYDPDGFKLLTTLGMKG